MAQIISRLFDDPGMAHGAAAALRKHRVFAGRVDVLLPLAAPDAADADVPDRVVAGHGQLRSARFQASAPGGPQAADCIRVTVDAAWGSALLAIEILERFDPLGDGEDQVPAAPSPDEPAPLSSALGIPLLAGSPAPLSRLLGLPVLAGTSTTFSAVPGIPLLLRARPDVSGIAEQSRNPAPLSRLLRLPTLSSRAAPLSSLLRIRVQADEPAPLSRLLGLPVLIGT